jgi:hypothetical protein
MTTKSERDVPLLPRRGLGLALLGAELAAPAIARAQGSLKKLKVSIGRQPWSAGNSPATQ